MTYAVTYLEEAKPCVAAHLWIFRIEHWPIQKAFKELVLDLDMLGRRER